MNGYSMLGTTGRLDDRPDATSGPGRLETKVRPYYPTGHVNQIIESRLLQTCEQVPLRRSGQKIYRRCASRS